MHNVTGATPTGTQTKTLQYWQQGIPHNSIEGYIDTFSVGDTKFRVVDSCYDSVTQKGGGEGNVQKLVNGQWLHSFSIILGMHSDYSHDQDANGDGYNDFISNARYGADVYFFHPDKKEFDTADADVFEVSNEWVLLDSARNIFCDDTNVKGIEDNTRLYTFNGFKLVTLYTLDFEHENDKEGTKMTTEMNLYKGETGPKSTALKTTPINKPSEEYDFGFDYVAYWKENYKQLLGY
jgi:hypothetical protein